MGTKGFFSFPLEIRREVYTYLCPIWTKQTEYGRLRLTCRQVREEYDAESINRAKL
jgi:hypothetical protein